MKYSRNRANSDEILRHLQKCDESFVPPLSERVDLEEYAEKLAFRAHRVEAWSASRLVGLVAIYFNKGRAAFITNVSVCPDLVRQGLARKLIWTAASDARAENCPAVELEVNTGAAAARALYGDLGFVEVPNKNDLNGPMICLRLELAD